MTDPIGIALDRRGGVDPGVREVTGVDAQIEICVRDEPLDLVRELDVSPGVRMDDGTQPVVSGDHGDTLDLLEHRLPSISIESLGTADRPAVRTRMSSGRSMIESTVPPDAAIAGSPVRRADHPIGLTRIVQIIEDERADRGQLATPQHVAERLGILGEISDRSELEGADA